MPILPHISRPPMVLDLRPVVNERTRTVHRAFCQSLILVFAKAQPFRTTMEAIEKGYSPCRVCKPQLRLLGNTKSQTVHLEGHCTIAGTKGRNIREFDSFTAALDAGYHICRLCRTPGVYSLLCSRPPRRDDLKPLVDAYERIAWIELSLSYAVRRVLVDAFGDRWWKDGVPQNIRAECASLREADENEDVCEPYMCTNFIHLSEIIRAKWKWFEKKLPKDLARDGKESLKSSLVRLNAFRNRVMHPVKNSDFEDFVSNESLVLGEQLDPVRWSF